MCHEKQSSPAPDNVSYTGFSYFTFCMNCWKTQRQICALTVLAFVVFIHFWNKPHSYLPALMFLSFGLLKTNKKTNKIPPPNLIKQNNKTSNSVLLQK